MHALWAALKEDLAWRVARSLEQQTALDALDLRRGAAGGSQQAACTAAQTNALFTQRNALFTACKGSAAGRGGRASLTTFLGWQQAQPSPGGVLSAPSSRNTSLNSSEAHFLADGAVRSDARAAQGGNGGHDRAACSAGQQPPDGGDRRRAAACCAAQVAASDRNGRRVVHTVHAEAGLDADALACAGGTAAAILKRQTGHERRTAAPADDSPDIDCIAAVSSPRGPPCACCTPSRPAEQEPAPLITDAGPAPVTDAAPASRLPATLHLRTLFTDAGGIDASACSSVVVVEGHIDCPAVLKGWRGPGSPLLLAEEAVLGLGGFGLVTRVTDLATGCSYALKRLLRSEALLILEHVLEEQEVVRQLQGAPFCTRQLGTFQDSQYLYILMEQCPGGDLDVLLQLVARKTLLPRRNWLAAAVLGPLPAWVGLPEPTARFYACGLLLALHDLHVRHIVYRDAKPGNLLLDEGGYPRLADFGMAKVLGPNGRSSLPCGTLDFMAPEVVRCELGRDRSSRPNSRMAGSGTPRSPRFRAAPTYGIGADWWAFGATLYTLLTGCKLFVTPEAEAQEEPERVLYKIVNARVEVRYPPYLSADAKDLLQKLLVRQPRWRLGCQGRDALEVMEHPWFQGVDWDAYRARKLQAPELPRGLGMLVGAQQASTLAAEFLRRAASERRTAARRKAAKLEEKLAAAF